MIPGDDYLLLKHRHDDLTEGPQFAGPPGFTSFGYFKKRIIKMTNYIYLKENINGTQIQKSALRNKKTVLKAAKLLLHLPLGLWELALYFLRFILGSVQSIWLKKCFCFLCFYF